VLGVLDLSHVYLVRQLLRKKTWLLRYRSIQSTMPKRIT